MSEPEIAIPSFISQLEKLLSLIIPRKPRLQDPISLKIAQLAVYSMTTVHTYSEALDFHPRCLFYHRRLALQDQLYLPESKASKKHHNSIYLISIPPILPHFSEFILSSPGENLVMFPS
jgi:hypothetical protein